MGIRGAAVATVMSQAASAAWVLSFLFGKRAGVGLSLGVMRLHLPTVGKICALGVSPFVMASTESLVGFALNGQLYRFGGDIHVSALTVMQSAMQMVSVPLSGFTQGVVPILGYNLGHRRPDRVRSCFYLCLLVVFSVNLVGMLAMMLMPATVARAFTSDPVLIDTVRKYLPLFLAGMTIFGLQRCCQNTFVALGQAKISLFIALLRKVILLVPLAYILPEFMEVSGVYAAEAIADGAAAIICTVIFFSLFPGILRRCGEGE
jgi:Na+-driven multidrug efflux pump